MAGIAWIKEQWGGNFIINGILDPEDARSAVAAGADAIVVSNHGGRQLDGAISLIRSLPEIVREFLVKSKFFWIAASDPVRKF